MQGYDHKCWIFSCKLSGNSNSKGCRFLLDDVREFNLCGFPKYTSTSESLSYTLSRILMSNFPSIKSGEGGRAWVKGSQSYGLRVYDLKAQGSKLWVEVVRLLAPDFAVLQTKTASGLSVRDVLVLLKFIFDDHAETAAGWEAVSSGFAAEIPGAFAGPPTPACRHSMHWSVFFGTLYPLASLQWARRAASRSRTRGSSLGSPSGRATRRGISQGLRPQEGTVRKHWLYNGILCL